MTQFYYINSSLSCILIHDFRLLLQSSWDVRVLKAQLRKQEIKYPIITLSKNKQGRSGQEYVDCLLWLWVNLHKGFVPQDQTVGQHLYIEFLRHLREDVRRKCSYIWNLYQDQTPAHMAWSGQPLLNENKMAVFPHLTYTPKQTPCDFFPLKFEYAVKGWNTQEVREMLPAVGKALGLVYELQ